jgi:excisionase family DNA binding protein
MDKVKNENIAHVRCMGMMFELSDRMKRMHHTLYSIKGKLTFSEAREYLGVSQTELNALVRNKSVACTKLSAKKYLFDAAELDAYLEREHAGKEV